MFTNDPTGGERILRAIEFVKPLVEATITTPDFRLTDALNKVATENLPEVTQDVATLATALDMIGFGLELRAIQVDEEEEDVINAS